MKTAVVYYSKHHSNTKKILDAIAKDNEITLIDVNSEQSIDLSSYDRIGFASGIYYSKFHKKVLKFARENMPKNKECFFVYTYGAKKDGYTNAITDAVKEHGAKIIGEFGCFGFNTYGPFKLIGGIAKGHPNEKDLSDAIDFYKNL